MVRRAPVSGVGAQPGQAFPCNVCERILRVQYECLTEIGHSFFTMPQRLIDMGARIIGGRMCVVGSYGLVGILERGRHLA